MDQNPAARVAEAPVRDESSALEALKKKVEDPSTPTLDLARALQAHLKTYPQSHEFLAAKLSMKRPYMTQVLGLLALPKEIQAEMEGHVLSSWNIRKRLHNKPAQASTITATITTDTTTTATDTATATTDTATIATNTATTTTDAENNENNSATTLSNRNTAGSTDETPLEVGFPLIRDTVNGLSKLLWWVKDAHFGELADRWLVYFWGKGWLMIALTGVVLGFTLVGAYQTTHYIYSHAGAFCWRFKTAAFQQTGGPAGSEPGWGSAAPRITAALPKAGHRLELKWTAVPGALKYRVFWHTPNGQYVHPVDQDVDSLGAVVDVSPGWKEGYLSVAAISAGNIESPHSEKIAFVPTGENDTDKVEPLPPSEQAGTTTRSVANGGLPEGRDNRNSGMTGTAAKGGPIKGNRSPPSRSSRPNGTPAATAPSAVPAPSAQSAAHLIDASDATQVFQSVLPQNASITQRLGTALAVIAGKAVTSGAAAIAGIPTPQGFQWERGLNGTIRLRWISVGNGFRYTVYGAYAGPHPAFDVCFHPPMSGTIFNWTPPAQGPKVYDLYAVAVDAKGNESLPSPHLIIDLRDSQ